MPGSDVIEALTYYAHRDKPKIVGREGELEEIPGCDCIPDLAFPTALDNLTCNRYEIAEFAKQAWALGVNYQGVCCGAGPHHIRAMAEALGNSPTRKLGRAGEAALTARQQRTALSMEASADWATPQRGGEASRTKPSARVGRVGARLNGTNRPN